MTDKTKRAFADWCRKQPANKRYDWSSDTNCALAQFARSVGATPKDLPLAWEAIAMNGHEGWTFGELATRLRS